MADLIENVLARLATKGIHPYRRCTFSRRSGYHYDVNPTVEWGRLKTLKPDSAWREKVVRHHYYKPYLLEGPPGRPLSEVRYEHRLFVHPAIEAQQYLTSEERRGQVKGVGKIIPHIDDVAIYPLKLRRSMTVREFKSWFRLARQQALGQRTARMQLRHDVRLSGFISLLDFQDSWAHNFFNLVVAPGASFRYKDKEHAVASYHPYRSNWRLTLKPTDSLIHPPQRMRRGELKTMVLVETVERVSIAEWEERQKRQQEEWSKVVRGEFVF